MITLENVSKHYGNGTAVYALRQVTLTLQRGERVAVMGPSGSGKSTLLNVICGLDEPSEGRILFEGTDLATLDDDARTRLRRDKIGMVFQTFNLMPTLTTLENVALPLRLQGRPRREADQSAQAMVDRVGLSARLTHRPDELSGGERQRVAIARALIDQAGPQAEQIALKACEDEGALDFFSDTAGQDTRRDEEAEVRRRLDSFQHRVVLLVILREEVPESNTRHTGKDHQADHA